jgi:hypothetical protein
VLFNAYLSKPLRQSQLFDTLVGLLGVDDARPAGAAAARAARDRHRPGRPSIPLRILLRETTS